MFLKKKLQVLTPEEKAFQRTIKRRKRVLRLILVLGTLSVLIVCLAVFFGHMLKNLEPQLVKTVVEISRVLPELEENEAAIRGVYDKMSEGREELAKEAHLDLPESRKDGEVRIEELLSDTLSWTEQTANLRIGQNGCITVVSKENGAILEHPVEDYVGIVMRNISFNDYQNNGAMLNLSCGMTEKDLSDDPRVIRLGDIKKAETLEDLSGTIMFVYPENVADPGIALELMMYGCVLSYKDTYIICGITTSELVNHVIAHSLLCTVFFLILGLLFCKYITLVMERHEEELPVFRKKLLSYGALSLALLLLFSWYTEVLSDMTDNMNAMKEYSEVGVATLSVNALEEQEILKWLDGEYLIQCEMAAEYVNSVGRDNLTREDMKKLADTLGVTYVYAFDENGNVVVTGSPYDHFRLSLKEEDQSYAFRVLLDGTDHLVQEPMKDDEGEYMQYIGVSTRNKEDLCDGFVQIAVDPSVRDQIVQPLNFDRAMTALTVGMPELAMLVKKDTLEIVSSSDEEGKYYTLPDLGIDPKNIQDAFRGFIKIFGKSHYIGVSAIDENAYVVTMMASQSTMGAFFNALKVTLSALVVFLLLTITALVRYQKKVLEAGAALPKPEDEKSEEEADSEEIEEENEERGIFAGVTKLLKTEKKEKMEERWHYHSIPKEKQSPEMRIRGIVYWLLLFFCAFVLLPKLYFAVSGASADNGLNVISYIFSGAWNKGFNIFAVTACGFLLCGLYVGVVLFNRILYLIARISSTRVETICLLLKNSIKYICAVVFVYYGLSQFGAQTQTLLASAGILTLVIGMGAQDLVKDIVAGFFMIFEGTLQVGDFISGKDWYGTVQEIGLRTTKVTFFSDTRVFNNASLKDYINASGDVARAIVSITLPYDVDLPALEKVLEEELPPLKDRIRGLVREPKYRGVSKLDANSLTLEIALYVESVKKEHAVRALNRELRRIFDHSGVAISNSQISHQNVVKV